MRRAPAVFRNDGESWTLVYEGTVVRLRAAKGLHYLAHLLGRPGEPVHVAILAATAGEAHSDRGDAGAGVERLRKAVGNRIRETLARIRERHDPLGRHLANAIHTGLRCRYDPERPISWQIHGREDRGREVVRGMERASDEGIVGSTADDSPD